jgi:hypothetical protein
MGVVVLVVVVGVVKFVVLEGVVMLLWLSIQEHFSAGQKLGTWLQFVLHHIIIFASPVQSPVDKHCNKPGVDLLLLVG